MSKAKLDAARELIREKKYIEARAVLRTVDHPTAQKWLEKIDSIAPEQESASRSQTNTAMLSAVAVLLIIIVGLMVAIIVLLSRPAIVPDEVAALATWTNSLEDLGGGGSAPFIFSLFGDTPQVGNVFSTVNSSLGDGPNIAVSTDIMTATEIPESIVTARPSSTPIPTTTPQPTQPARPTLPPTWTPVPQTKQLGPIYNSLREESYTVEISISNVRFTNGTRFNEPRSGYVFLIVDISFRNQGPDTIRSLSPYDFQVRDSNGVLRDSGYVSEADDCRLDIVDLSAGGLLQGCIGFEVPQDGRLELIYAPYRYEGLTEGRYLSFELR